MAADPSAADARLAARAGLPPLNFLLGRLSLRQRLMVVPLLALVLTSVLTAGFVYQGSRQATLLDRIAKVELVETDLQADLMNALLVEHLAMQDMLRNAGEMDSAALYDVGKGHLNRIYEAVHELEQFVPKTVAIPAAGAPDPATAPIELVALMQAYRRSVATVVEVATIDAKRLPPLIKVANERFGAFTVGFEKYQDLRRGEILTDIGKRARLDRWATGLAALGGFVTALLLLALSFGLSRVLVRSLENQISALAALGRQAGAATPAAGGDEVERIGQAITAFRAVLQQLQRSEAEFRTLAEAMPQIVWTTSPGGRGLYFSRQWMEYTGLTLEQSLDRGWLKPLHADDEAAAFEAWSQATATRGNPSFECRLRRADGEYRWWLVRGAPLLDTDGKILKWFGTCTDIQDLKEVNTDLEQRVDARTLELNLAREEADRANHAKSDFLATMSHEIRTPMNGLMGLLELLALSQLDTEQHATLTGARESGVALLRLIDDILDFSKIEANFLELDPAPASVRDLVASVCRLHSQIASSKNLTLQSHVAPDISPLLAFDAFRLGQILNNFLNNAIKFTEKGTVEIDVELLGRAAGKEQLRFAVRDSGIGIAPEDLSRLFQPFVQADAGTSSRFGGTGLGLVISRRLAELMAGSVEVQSEPGRGTTMLLTVAFAPCEPGSEPRHPASAGHAFASELMTNLRPAPSVREAEQEGSLLLVVDDHPTNRMMLMRQLASLGYAAESAADGVEALALFKSGRFGAVITDCNMPRMNGYQLATAIRDRERNRGDRAVPIIGCTANALPSAVVDCLHAGMDDCLVKPVGLAEVSRKLTQWLPLGHLRRPDTVTASLPLPLGTGTAPPAGNGLVDHLLLGEITGHDAQLQAQVLAEFRRVNDLDAAAMRRVAASNDFAEVMKYSHRIKGASLMLGATSLAELCGRVEAASAAGNPQWLRAAMADFEPELRRLDAYVDKLSAGKPPRGQSHAREEIL